MANYRIVNANFLVHLEKNYILMRLWGVQAEADPHPRGFEFAELPRGQGLMQGLHYGWRLSLQSKCYLKFTKKIIRNIHNHG